MLKYDAVDEFKTRLNGTYLRLGDEILWSELSGASIQDPNDPDTWFVFLSDPWHKKEPIKVMNGDPKVRTDFKLGMVNTAFNGTKYVLRMPVRKFKCGLYNEGVRVINPVSPGLGGGNINTLLKNGALLETLLNKYPDYESSEKTTRDQEGEYCSAFSRYFALKWDGLRQDYVLIYKTKIVGFGKDRKFILADDFKYLRETLEEQKVHGS